MVAKLISPPGEEFELTDEQFYEVKHRFFQAHALDEIEQQLHNQFEQFVEARRQQYPDLAEHSHNQLAILDLIEANKFDE